MTDKIKKLKKDNISILVNPLNPPADLVNTRELHEMIHGMRLEADLHTKYMSEEERRHNTTVKPIYDDFNGFYDDFLEKQITRDNQLDEALRATIAGEEISFNLKKALLD